MTLEDRIEHRLRRSADDIRATVVQRAAPPPLDDLERRSPLLRVAAVLLVVGGLLGMALALTTGGDESVAPSERVPVVEASLCEQVAEVTAGLEPPPIDRDGWRFIAIQHAQLATAIEAEDAASRERLEPDVLRRVDRFMLLVGLAVEDGNAGRLLPAASRATDAAAVGRDLVGALDRDGCAVPPKPSAPPATPPEPGG